MPSIAKRSFRENARDIERLLEIHAEIGGTGPGRRVRLEVLNKSAIVLISACWEAYCEDVAAEMLNHIVEHARGPSRLPKELKKRVAKEVRAEKNELAPWDLAGGGWRRLLRTRLATMKTERDRRVNTPKSVQIDSLFEEAIGFPTISGAWRWRGMSRQNARRKLDEFVELRGAIAHRGSAAESCHKSDAVDFLAHVQRLVTATESALHGFARDATGRVPWIERVRIRLP